MAGLGYFHLPVRRRTSAGKGKAYFYGRFTVGKSPSVHKDPAPLEPAGYFRIGPQTDLPALAGLKSLTVYWLIKEKTNAG
jgi:hypothetical protein